jgi:hypothetical protein
MLSPLPTLLHWTDLPGYRQALLQARALGGLPRQDRLGQLEACRDAVAWLAIEEALVKEPSMAVLVVARVFGLHGEEALMVMGRTSEGEACTVPAWEEGQGRVVDLGTFLDEAMISEDSRTAFTMTPFTRDNWLMRAEAWLGPRWQALRAARDTRDALTEAFEASDAGEGRQRGRL